MTTGVWVQWTDELQNFYGTPATYLSDFVPTPSPTLSP